MRSYYEKKKENKVQELLSTVLSYYILGLFILIAIFGVLYVVNIESTYLELNYLLPIVAYIFPKQLIDLYNIIMRMEHQAKRYLVYNLASIFLIALLGIASVVFIEASVEVILWSVSMGNFIASIVAFFSIKKKYYITPTFVYFKEIFYYSLPIVPAVIGGWTTSAVGRIYIIEYLNMNALAIYSLALKVGMIYLLFAQAFRMTWQPFMMKKFEDENAKYIFAKALNIYFLIGLFVVVVIAILSPFIVNILGTSAYVEASTLVPVFLLAYFWQGALNIISAGNSWKRKTYLNSIGNILGSVTVVILTYFLIQKIGVLGAAIGQLCGFVLSFFVTMYFAQKNVYIPYSKLVIFGIIGVTFMSIAYSIKLQ